jgi:replicative DNA helicase
MLCFGAQLAETAVIASEVQASTDTTRTNWLTYAEQVLDNAATVCNAAACRGTVVELAIVARCIRLQRPWPTRLYMQHS